MSEHDKVVFAEYSFFHTDPSMDSMDIKHTTQEYGDIRVSIRLPDMTHTITSQIRLHADDVRLLRKLNKPKYLPVGENERFEALRIWEADRELANKVLETISHNIVLSLARALEREYGV